MFAFFLNFVSESILMLLVSLPFALLDEHFQQVVQDNINV